MNNNSDNNSNVDDNNNDKNNNVSKTNNNKNYDSKILAKVILTFITIS